MSRSNAQTGVWFVGARGSVATTAVAGCAAVTAGLHPPTGMVTETPPFAGSGLPALSSAAMLGAHTYAVTTVSRHEAQGGSTAAPLAALAATLGLGALAARERRGPGLKALLLQLAGVDTAAPTSG